MEDRPAHGVRLPIDDREEGSGRTARDASLLFPVANGRYADAEGGGELRLRQVRLATDGAYVDDR